MKLILSWKRDRDGDYSRSDTNKKQEALVTMWPLRNIFSYPIDALNLVKTNVWSVLLIAIGSVLVLHGKDAVGGSLVTGGFALLRGESSSSRDTAAPITTVPDPNAPKG